MRIKNKLPKKIPMISVIIPVLHEEEGINSLINHLYNQSGAKDLEVIVIDADPRKGTINAIERRNSVISVISEKGRGRQMNVGAETASRDILLFLHADTRLPPGGLKQITSTLREKRYIGGAFDLEIASDKTLIRLIGLCASLRSRLTRIPFGDQAIFIRKDYFKRIGGYKEIPLMEDVELMRRIRKHGDKIYIIKTKVKTSPRRWEKEGILFTTLRNWSLQFLFSLGVSPDRLSRFYP